MSNYTYFNHSLSWGGGGWDNDLDLIFLWKQDDQRLNRYHHLLILSVWLCKIFMHFWILQVWEDSFLNTVWHIMVLKLKFLKYKYICIYNKLFISHFFSIQITFVHIYIPNQLNVCSWICALACIYLVSFRETHSLHSLVYSYSVNV